MSFTAWVRLAAIARVQTTKASYDPCGPFSTFVVLEGGMVRRDPPTPGVLQ